MVFYLFKFTVLRNQPYQNFKVLLPPIPFDTFSFPHSSYQKSYFSILLSIISNKMLKFRLERLHFVFLKALEEYLTIKFDKLVYFSAPIS